MNRNRLGGCEQRLYSRVPVIGAWIRCRAAEALARDKSADAARLLAEALIRSKDERVRIISQSSLTRMDQRDQIDAACQVWADTRHPDLAALLQERCWVVSKLRAEVRVLTALKTSQPLVLEQDGPETAGPLLTCCDDADADISRTAIQFLRQLLSSPLQEAVCARLVEYDHPTARQAVVDAGYVPSDPVARTLFLFMTEQWSRYEALDFDQSQLRAIYESADSPLRKRIGDKLRIAGRTEFLKVMVGGDSYSRAATMTEEELRLVLKMLHDKREWYRLWKLAFDVPLSPSVQILRSLSRSGWQPTAHDERVAFERLAQVVSSGRLSTSDEISSAIPPAHRRAGARIAGRINDIAFAPTTSSVALATGNRRVVMWDFHRAHHTEVIEGFNHSVGHVRFSGNGKLVCAERTNKSADCAVTCWLDGRLRHICEHVGSVTNLEPVGDCQMLVTGRDQGVGLWDIDAQARVAQTYFHFWARATCIALGGRVAILLHHNALPLQLPDLTPLDRMLWLSMSMPTCAACNATGEVLIEGNYAGQVWYHELQKGGRYGQKHEMLGHNGRVRGVAVLPNNHTVVTAGSDGALHFSSMMSRALLAKVETTPASVTSLRVSPDGKFMALGQSDGSISLWDLRLLNVPELASQPFAHATPDHLAGVSMAMEHAGDNEGLKRTLQFMECILRFRFRHDIDIDDVPIIQAGEFDIEVEG